MFKKLFGKSDQNTKANRQESDDGSNDRLQLAVAALLIEAARADEQYLAEEKVLIIAALQKQFGLTTEAAVQLCAAGDEAQAKAMDIQRFTRIVKTMSDADKIGFIEILWEIIFADGERDPYEDSLVRRICGLIYVSDRDSGAARARIMAALGSK